MQSRLLRLRDAPGYLGMDRNRFNAEVRPYVPEIPIGSQGIAFDRLDLDAWVDEYKSRNGRPADRKEDPLWDADVYKGSANAAGPGTSKSRSKDMVRFMKAVERLTYMYPASVPEASGEVLLKKRITYSGGCARRPF
ncbi:MAG: hypothetical protein ACREVK_11755 [Gammaproteobacteria bacterium]